MKYKFCLLITILWSGIMMAQENPDVQDPAAGKILDKVSLKFKTLQSLQADFELIIDDRKENTSHSSSGNLIFRQNRYKLHSDGSTVFYDGKTMWTYMPANNEVTITEPSPDNTDFMSNPGGFFLTYKTDFKYRYIGESKKNGVTCYEIDLFPKNLNQPYSRIKIFINTVSGLPEIIKSVGKDGVDYTVVMKNTVLDRVFPDSTFVFDPSKFKKIEIIDMRGI